MKRYRTSSKAVQLNPNNAQYWKALGVAQASLDQLRQAVEPFRQACTLAPSLLDACYYYGRSLYATDQYERALAPLEIAMKVDAVKGRAEAAIGQCNEALGRTVEAERWLRLALTRNDAARQIARVAYGRFLVRQGRAAEAVTVLEGAQQPETAEARYELGFALFHAIVSTRRRPHCTFAHRTEYLADILPGMASRNRLAVAHLTPARWLASRH